MGWGRDQSRPDGLFIPSNILPLGLARMPGGREQLRTSGNSRQTSVAAASLLLRLQRLRRALAATGSLLLPWKKKRAPATCFC
jgi:hypothetical protein